MVLGAVSLPLWDTLALMVGAGLLYLHHRKDTFWTWALSLLGWSAVLSVGLRAVDWVLGWRWYFWPLGLLPVAVFLYRRIADRYRRA